MSVEKYLKKDIIEALKLVSDEPNVESKLFDYERYTKQLCNLLKDPYPESPFSICLNGEWGEGKTSLLKRVYNQLNQEVKDKKIDANFRVIWFDAWQYEWFDVVLALMQKIIKEYSNRDNEIVHKLESLLLSLVRLSSDIVLRKTFDMSEDELMKHFNTGVSEIDTVANNLDKIIGTGRLIVFIDDLDRCSIDNIMDMLEAIKMLFNSKHTRFVVGVDLSKLERAWTLKYGDLKEGVKEGEEHVDKIFQLKISLPKKDDVMIKEYIKSITQNLNPDFESLLIRGMPYNPRKIKRALNLTYFIAKDIPDDQFSKQFPFVLIWSMLTTTFPSIARVISSQPKILIDLCKVVFKTETYYNLQRLLYEARNLTSTKGAYKTDFFDTISLPDVSHPETADLIINHLSNDPSFYNFVKAINEFFHISSKQNNGEEMAYLERVVKYAGLIS